eukprot:TRINITY_DN61762_c0_g1_i1.p1 TRINITY_DN61762_c0_g1~~TRINITY_DN61762_c0_g1_i1.p1  ORF type:complete len:368 (-),score=51.64 TRINITY_DN61762_c0_g1_i1:51-1106(-)
MASGTKSESTSLIDDAKAEMPNLSAGQWTFVANVRQATATLILGTSLIIVGLAVSLACTPGPLWLPTASEPSLQLNMYGEPFPSGWPYVPTSVSATINNPETAPGRIFQASVLTGAIMIMISNYPMFLSNVYFGPSSLHGYPIINSLRAYAIPAGIILVALCPVADVNMMTTGMSVAMYGFHMVGALGAIIVFCVCEFHDLGDASIKFVGYEKGVRTFLVWGVVVFTVIFVIGEALGTLPTSWTGICCFDTYLEVNETAIEAAAKNKAYIQKAEDEKLMQLYTLSDEVSPNSALYKGLYDTAHGFGLAVRVMGVWAEEGIFFCMLWSYVAVWYFCPERNNPVPQRDAKAWV